MIPFLVVFLFINHPAETAEVGNVPRECQQPIKCINSTTLSFCGMIDGVEQNVGQNYVCPDGYECSTQNKFQPCVFKPPECSAVGAGKFAASKCNEYYECYKTLWWWSQSLNTCPQDQAFSTTSKQCVAIAETDCVFLLINHAAEATEVGNLPTECQQPNRIKCLNFRKFSFCGMINGVEQNVGQNYFCPDGYECSQNELQPCVKPPECIILGTEKIAASKCNEYYECFKTPSWWSRTLNICPPGQAFSTTSKQCVAIAETNCVI